MSETEAFAGGRDGDLAGLLREVEGWSARVAGTLDELGRERLEGVDARGAVRARVAGTGRLLGLHLDPRKLRELDHVQLAEAVKEAVGAARAGIAERLAELTGDPAGPGAPAHGGVADPLADHVRRVMREG
ncbi:YbaB/EbfC family nucleoid-associated protein [Nonomuraea sp. NPDC050783]|uniref:YbaB/EbfC family nucleoid-associated protein n=1 Tax=Nonomuraea sp. NPDC050783 TaxID=3154634 RepID=UPI003464ECD7